MKNRKLLVLTILFQFLWITIVQSQVTISGKVVDQNGDHLIGATIIDVNNETIGTITDIKGKFKLEIDANSSFEVSYPGYNSKTIKVSDYKGKDIFITESFVCEPSIIIIYPKFMLGYRGDLSKMPYGIKFSKILSRYFRTSNKVMLTTLLKTDFENNYDGKAIIYFNSSLFRNKIDHTTSFQKRKYENIDIHDYKTIFSKKIKNIVSLHLGYTFKDNLGLKHHNHGVVLGFNKYINKIGYFKSDISIYKGFTEYNIGYQTPSKIHNSFWDRILKNITIGIEYQKYQEYDEVNLSLFHYFY